LEDQVLDELEKESNVRYQGTDFYTDAKVTHKQRMRELQHDEDEDPYEVFGYGITAYFKMLEILIKLFIGMVILMAPITFLYYHGYAFDHL